MAKKERIFPLNTFGGRIQDLRKNRLKISRPEFYDLIYSNENVANESKSRTVKNWESGDCEPDLKTIKKICVVLKCSSDYLLGLDSCTTKDKQFIHDYTGLSEETIEQINILNNIKEITDTLDDVFRQGLFDAVISLNEGRKNLNKYLKKTEEILERSKYLQANPHIMENREETSQLAKEMGSFLSSTKLNILNAQNRFFIIIKKLIPLDD